MQPKVIFRFDNFWMLQKFSDIYFPWNVILKDELPSEGIHVCWATTDYTKRQTNFENDSLFLFLFLFFNFYILVRMTNCHSFISVQNIISKEMFNDFLHNFSGISSSFLGNLSNFKYVLEKKSLQFNNWMVSKYDLDQYKIKVEPKQTITFPLLVF